jgi:preprotein translocase subunit SecA
VVHHVNQALRAHKLFHRDKDYIVRNDEVVIIDEFTGRMMPGRRYSEGLHQALEAKERQPIQPENQTLAQITFQNYFRMYEKLAGMTGTALTEADEFIDIYNLEVVEVPTNMPMVRLDDDDEVYRTAAEKYRSVLALIEDCKTRGQPVLVGTTSIENSELLSTYLQKEKLPHEVLNAKQHAREAEIVAQAGRPKMITIATNMAGRGTDIVLGGNVEKAVEAVEADESLDAAAKQQKIAQLREQWQRDHEFVVAQGGLRIIAPERHESRRIDNQLRGRSGRQGDPGSSRFYLSLDDPLMRIFAGERVKAIMERLKMPDGEAIEAGIVSRSIESAQRKVEARNFDIRKQLLEYDDVANDQRKVIYQQRNDILDATDLSAQIASLREGCFTDLTHQYVPPESVEEQWDIPGLEKTLGDEWQIQLSLQKEVQAASSITDEDILEKMLKAADEAFAAKVQQVGAENFTQFERIVLLQSIDSHWREHLSALDYLRQGIHLRGYAQKQPKQEYKREAFELFGQLLDSVKNEVTKILMTVSVQSGEQLEQAAEDLEDRAERIANVTYSAPTETGGVETVLDERTARQIATAAIAKAAIPRVGRNDPCPCGSGKKYKHCHGKLA